MSAKALAQDMYIEELERNLSDAARMMLEDDYHGDQSQQLTDWLNAANQRASYDHIHQTHIQVCHLYFQIYADTIIGGQRGRDPFSFWTGCTDSVLFTQSFPCNFVHFLLTQN